MRGRSTTPRCWNLIHDTQPLFVLFLLGLVGYQDFGVRVIDTTAFHERASMQHHTSTEYISSIFVSDRFPNLDLHCSLIDTSIHVLTGSRMAFPAISSSTAVTYWGRPFVWQRRIAGPKPLVMRLNINGLRLDSLPGLSPLLSTKLESRKHVADQHSFDSHTLYP